MNKAFDDLFAQVSAGQRRRSFAPTSAFTPSRSDPAVAAASERNPVPETLLSTVEAVPGRGRGRGGDVERIRADDRPGDGRDDRRRRAAHARRELERDSTDVAALAPSRATRRRAPTRSPSTRRRRRSTTSPSASTIKILFQGPPREFTISGIAGFGERGQPGRRDARDLRHADRAGGARQGGGVRRDRRRGRRRDVAAGPAHRASSRCPARRASRPSPVVRRRRRAGEAAAGGARVLPDRAARLRVHRAVRRARSSSSTRSRSSWRSARGSWRCCGRSVRADGRC